MKINRLKKLLLVTPVLVLLLTLFFLNYTVQSFKDTAYTFFYDTNVGSVQRFGRELAYLEDEGYPSQEYSELYSKMIYNYSRTLGEKEAIVTFMLDEAGNIGHSTKDNRAHLEPLLENENNMALVNSAFESANNGEIVFESDTEPITIYYHHFYSGADDYKLYMFADRLDIDKKLNIYGVAIPICVIGLLLLFVIEFGIIHMVQDILRDNNERLEREEE